MIYPNLYAPFTFFKLVYFERERETVCVYAHAHVWEDEREVGRENPNTVRVKPDAGLELTSCEIMT